jgi:nucleoside-diphosphate-sugar epimerase
MRTYLIVGAGAIGSVVATQLADQGHHVRMLSRRGSGPQHPLIELISGDASDLDTVTTHAGGTDALFNCASPAYHRWPTDWPPIAAALLGAAAATGSGLVTLNNLYAYGHPTGPMSPHDPLNANYEKAQVRATMWRRAKEAHDDGRIRATEVRASDFIGPNAQSYLGQLVPRILAGKSCQVIGDIDALHSWNYTVDVARTLVTVAHDDRSWGRAWHAPANPACSVRSAINDVADSAGVTHPKITKIPTPVLRVIGLFNREVRELPTTLYQFNAPFVIDDLETRSVFGIEPTPWHDVVKETIAFYANARDLHV